MSVASRLNPATVVGGDSGGGVQEATGLANLIRSSRIRAGISGRQLSALAHLSPSYVGKIEAGEIEPSLRAFARIAVALGMNSYEICLCITEAAR